MISRPNHEPRLLEKRTRRSFLFVRNNAGTRSGDETTTPELAGPFFFLASTPQCQQPVRDTVKDLKASCSFGTPATP